MICCAGRVPKVVSRNDKNTYSRVAKTRYSFYRVVRAPMGADDYLEVLVRLGEDAP
jgi:hypothetical protein